MDDSMMMDDDEMNDLSNQAVQMRYKAAADIVNGAMMALLQQIQVGQKIVDLCILGDKLIDDLAAQAAKKVKKEDKGIAFPTCVSVNNIVGHYSPLPEDPQKTLNAGDLVKIDLAAHVDGYISTAAHSYILGQSPDAGPSQGKMADAVCAAYFAAECAHKLLKPGHTNTEITQAIARVAALFQCKPVEGVLSHQIKQNILDGNNVIINRSEVDQQVDEFKFEANQVYGIDIVISTGEGKAREINERTTVFKRAIDRNYNLKLQASRVLLSEINKKHPILPFTLRSLGQGDEKKRRLGIVEIVKHELVDTYPVLFEKDGEFVAQFKFTALVLPKATLRLNSFPLPHVTSTHSVESDPEIVKILQMPTATAAKKKKKAKKPKQNQAPKQENQPQPPQPQQ